jgi:hypothetical protein
LVKIIDLRKNLKPLNIPEAKSTFRYLKIISYQEANNLPSKIAALKMMKTAVATPPTSPSPTRLATSPAQSPTATPNKSSFADSAGNGNSKD